RAAEFGLANAAVGDDVAEVLDRVKPTAVFDVVVPAAPVSAVLPRLAPAARVAVVRSALQRGCPVLSEKPLATSMEEARAIVAAARKAGRIHAVIQNRRFLSAVRRIRRLIDTGV